MLSCDIYRCKFCQNVHENLPQFAFTVLSGVGTEHDHDQVPIKSYVVKHVYNDRYQSDNQTNDFKCDNCEASFKRKVDLRRHEISQHFGEKHSCHLSGLNFTRYDNLLQHLGHVHDKTEKMFECESEEK